MTELTWRSVLCNANLTTAVPIRVDDARVQKFISALRDVDQIKEVRLEPFKVGSAHWRMRVWLVGGGLATWKFYADNLSSYTLVIDSNPWNNSQAANLVGVRRAVTEMKEQIGLSALRWWI